MYFVVFAAFAIVLSVPETGPPWTTLTSPLWRWVFVLGQVVLPGIIGLIYTRLVKNKLELEPSWLPSAQKHLNRGHFAIRIALAGGFMASVYLTDWVAYVRGWEWVQPVWGLDEMIVLLPFFAAILMGWIAIYPADRAVRQVAIELRLWASVPARPVWRLGKFLNFMFRHHVLIIAAPMIPIIVANDFINIYAVPIRRATGLAWSEQALLVLIAGGIFFSAPVVLKYIWNTRVLPTGDLRAGLEQLCKRAGLRYRQILIWESDGMLVNAAVMGLLGPVRYILLSDGLLEMMDDKKIEAVFGHEIGHIKHRHIQYYLLFAILSMLIVGGISELLMLMVRKMPETFTDIHHVQDYLQVIAMALIVVVWGLGFGSISRRFEWDADLFGARSVTPPADQCNRPCFVHQSETSSEPSCFKHAKPVCATAAHLFAEALHRIAVLNGIPIEARSWRHSSIGNRINLLKKYAADPHRCAALERSVQIIKIILLLGNVIGLAIAVWLYWPE